MDTSTATILRCSSCFNVGLGARHENDRLGASLDGARRRKQSVGVEKLAEEIANMPDQVSNALHSATAKEDASSTMYCK